jgi:hypothetical protein
MKKGDLIIWDSHFGYDVGYYSKEEGVMYDTCEIVLVTGVSEGKFSASHHEVKPFTKEKIEELNQRYQYKNNEFWTYDVLKERLKVRNEINK